MNAGSLDADSQLDLAHLTVRAESRDEYVVGDPYTGVFVSVPAVGALAVRLLAAGRTVGETADAVRARTGLDVDVVDLAESIHAAGLTPPVKRDRAPVRFARTAAVLFSGPAWTAYVSCFVGVLAMFVVEPGLLPTYEALYFVPDVFLSLLVLNALGMMAGALHELGHVLGGAAHGVPGRLRIGRRAYFLVLETDLTGLWALPRRQRYGPFLAGLAFDSVLMFGAVGTRFGWVRGWWDVPPVVLRLLGAFVLVQAFVMAFQGLAFMRTDGYMVLSTAVGGRNLHRVSALSLRRAVGLRLTAREKAELAGAHPADIGHARWYRLLYLLGIGWVLWFLVAYVWPSLRVIVGWTLITVQRGSPAQALWWEAALLLMVEAMFVVVPVVSFVQARIRRRA